MIRTVLRLPVNLNAVMSRALGVTAACCTLVLAPSVLAAWRMPAYKWQWALIGVCRVPPPSAKGKAQGHAKREAEAPPLALLFTVILYLL